MKSASPFPVPLPAPGSITIWRGGNCWLASVPDWNAWGAPLPFSESAPAHEVEAHLRRLHPGARIIFEEEPI